MGGNSAPDQKIVVIKQPRTLFFHFPPKHALFCEGSGSKAEVESLACEVSYQAE